MRATVVGAGLIAVLLTLTSSSAVAAGCPKRDLVVRAPEVSVFFVGNDLMVCVRSTGKRRIFVGDAGSSQLGLAAAARRFVAVELSDNYKCNTDDLFVMNAATGSTQTVRSGFSHYEDPANDCEGHGSRLSDLALRSDGSYAFITGGGEVVRSSSKRNILLVDQGQDVAPRSLGLTRSGIEWVRGGMRRRTKLPRTW